MRVYIGAAKFIVNAELIRENKNTAWVRLPEGNIVLRRKDRDFVNFEVDKITEAHNCKRSLLDRLVNRKPKDNVVRKG